VADQTTSTIVITAPPADVMAVIADFDEYPAWAQGVHVSRVVQESPEPGRPRQVYFELDAGPIRDAYTLEYDWHGDESVDWWLVQGRMLKGLDGTYELLALGEGSTEVTYHLSVEISVPMIGVLRRRAEKVIIDSALSGLKQRVETLAQR
jgi:ribosome-associated toxin RatA of RatAB toxin-antitoxin module